MSQAERPPPLHIVIEAARLAALHSYPMDCAAHDEPLDTLVRMAACAVNASIAMLSFIDRDHLDVRAAFGCDVRRMPRSLTLCHHTLAEPRRVLLVPDTLDDARFRGYPMVVMPPHIRFYVGVCLTDGDGYDLGALCTMDAQPSSLGADTLAALHGLARRAVDLLALRRAEQGPWQSGTVGEPPIGTPRQDRPVASELPVPGWLGVRTEHARLPGGAGEGRLLISVVADSPADRARLRVGDIILAIDGRAMRRKTDITATLASCTGGVVGLQVWRRDRTFDCALRLAPMPEVARLARRSW